MLRIVIAMASDDFGHMLEHQLNNDHSVVRCFDGNTALDLLQHLHPDVLLMDLSLAILDGLSLLEQSQEYLPELVVAVTDVANAEVCKRAEELGVSRLFLMPVDADNFLSQLNEMLLHAVPVGPSEDILRRRILQELNKLSFKPGLSGYDQILVGIPMVMKNKAIALGKELYPQIANILGLPSCNSMEHTIRTAIEDAYTNGNKELWQQYFPLQANREKPYPCNKQFFKTMANIFSTK